MKELINGLNVKSGYLISVTTWENDADDFSTQYFDGLTLEEVTMFSSVLMIFKPSYHGGEDLCNEDFYDIEDGIRSHLDKLLSESKISQDFVDKYFPRHNLLKALQTILGEPVQYDYDFIRVFDEMKVYFVDKPIITQPLKQIS